MKNKYIINNDTVTIFLHRRNGKPDIETQIDIDDFDKINAYNGTYYAHYFKNTKSYYVEITIYLGSNKIHKYQTIRMHRIITDCDDENSRIDHIDHNTLNNKKTNLRITNDLNNDKNRKKENSNNKTGYRNVCCINGKYIVQLQINKKNKLLGKFYNSEEANEFAIKMRKKYYGDFAGN